MHVDRSFASSGDTTGVTPVFNGVGALDGLRRTLQRRRDRLLSGGARSLLAGAVRVPVLAALAPAVGRTDEVVEYPGDPMALYSALVTNIGRSLESANTEMPERDVLRDFVLDWRSYPDREYHESVADSGIRTPLDRQPANSDELVFDARIWDEHARCSLQEALQHLLPRVVLVSAVSPAHRYALEIARLARRELPRAYIIMGGRHADETMRWATKLDELWLDPSSTASVRASDREWAPVDAVVSGDGAPLLDLLATAVCATLDSADDWVDPSRVGPALQALASWTEVEGSGVIGLLGPEPVAYPVTGRRFDPPPTPYGPFAIRSRFDVFPRAHNLLGDSGERSPGRRRTAHLMTAATCPFLCSFCSESSALDKDSPRLRVDDVGEVLQTMAQLVALGADAVFFDDPVFWSGQWPSIGEFVERMCRSRLLEDDALSREFPVLDSPALRSRWRDLHWGGQLTVDVVLDPRQDVVRSATKRLSEAGCRYVYLGIESMADDVMQHVRKNLHRRDARAWPVKVRDALGRLKDAGIPVGSSVLFGLDGESRDTINLTVERIGSLIDDGLLMLASPNVLTYHPATEIRRRHGIHQLDYHSEVRSRAPYVYFEEAYEGVVSRFLDEDDIWFIHQRTRARWGSTRNAARNVEVG